MAEQVTGIGPQGTIEVPFGKGGLRKIGLPEHNRVLSLYGVGQWTALLVVSEIGEIGRFPSAKHLCSCTGLVSSVHVSGNASYTRHIIKQGSKWLRCALVEAAHHTIQRPPYRPFYQKTAKRRGKTIAKVAVARKLLKPVYHIVREQEASPANEEKKRSIGFG